MKRGGGSYVPCLHVYMRVRVCMDVRVPDRRPVQDT